MGFVGIADDVGDTGERGQFFGGALSIAAGYDDLRGRIVGVEFADGVASLGVSGGGDGASIDDDNVGGLRRASEGTAAV